MRDTVIDDTRARSATSPWRSPSRTRTLRTREPNAMSCTGRIFDAMPLRRLACAFAEPSRRPRPARGPPEARPPLLANRHFVLISPRAGRRAQPATGGGKATDEGGRIRPGRGKNQPDGGCRQPRTTSSRAPERGANAAEHDSSTTPHVADMHRDQPLHLVFSGLTGTVARRSVRRSLDRRRPASVRPPRESPRSQDHGSRGCPTGIEAHDATERRGIRSQLPTAPRSGRPTAP